MGSDSPDRPLVSIVITVKNEERGLGRLLDSLLVQEPPVEILVVDALSRDRTFAIAERYAAEHPGVVRAARKFGSRGIGRNAGVALARGELVAFIDGDCIADSQWIRAIRSGFQTAEVVAGRTVAVGSSKYARLERVELFQQGSDVTYPSCNLAYRRARFEELHGFDPRFITAEDIDLNLRAVQAGARIRYVPFAVVYHQMRTTFFRFLMQAFWNGYGRKQLTEKHGSLWGNYRMRRLLAGQRSVVGLLRLAAAFSGYATRIVTGPSSKEADRARAAAGAAPSRGTSSSSEARRPS